MQDRYAGDIGDFAKYGLLRALTDTTQLGVAWYLYPDEHHNSDGKHIDYLKSPGRWRHLDPELFDALGEIVASRHRSLASVERADVLPEARFSRRLLKFDGAPIMRRAQRAGWFEQTKADLAPAPVIFADPDNGLCDDERYSPGRQAHWKRIPFCEVSALAESRTAIIYHHNTRRKGGHALEIQYWLDQMGSDAFALYWRPFSPRTFFVISPTEDLRRSAEVVVERWTPHFELHCLQ